MGKNQTKFANENEAAALVLVHSREFQLDEAELQDFMSLDKHKLEELRQNKIKRWSNIQSMYAIACGDVLVDEEATKCYRKQRLITARLSVVGSNEYKLVCRNIPIEKNREYVISKTGSLEVRRKVKNRNSAVSHGKKSRIRPHK